MKKIVANRHEDKVEIIVYEAGEPMWERKVPVEECANIDEVRQLLDHEMLEQEGAERLTPDEIEELRVQIHEALA